MNKETRNFINLTENMNVASMFRKAEKAKKSASFFEAVAIYREILNKFPANRKAQKELQMLAQANPIPDLAPLIQQKRYSEVEAILLSNIERDKNNPNFWKLLGNIYHEMGDDSLSLESYEKALELDPSDHELIFTIACDLLRMNDIQNSFKTFKLLNKIRPDFASIHTNLGVIYDKVERFEQAKSEWLIAVEKNPNENIALTHLGINAIKNEGDFATALEYFRTVEKILPEEVNNCVNIATAYFEMGEIEKAVEIYKSWEKRNWEGANEKEKYDFKLNYSLALFSLGEVEKAWENYSYRRFSVDISPTNLDLLTFKMLNNIENAQDKRLLILMEQGIGDQLFFYGLLKAFHEKTNAEITLQTEPRLQKLLETSFPEFQITTETQFENDNYDYWCLCGDIASLFKYSATSKGICAPYIKTERELSRDELLLFDPNRINIGLAWRSGLVTGRRLQNYTRLSDWSAIINDQSFNVVNLQYGNVSQDLDTLDELTRSNLKISKIDLKNDFENLGALINNCDIVVGPMTAPIVQAIAHGKKVLTYGLRGKDQWGFGLGLKSKKYESLWYSNSTRYIFNHHDLPTLINQIRDHINSEFR